MRKQLGGHDARPPQPQEHRPDAKCGRCGAELTPTLYCVDCGAWPINVTPVRVCACGSKIDLAGWCGNCHAIQGTRLIHTPVGFVDSDRKDRLLSREENADRMGLLRRIMAGEMDKAAVLVYMRGMERSEPRIGWAFGAMELETHPVGFHEDYLPAGMRRTSVVIGHTPSGAEIHAPKAFPKRDIAKEKRTILGMDEEAHHA